MESESHVLALAFDTDDPQFARGVEIGRLWERLRVEVEPVVEMVHVANAEMILRMAEALQRPVVSDEHDVVWMTVSFSAVAG